MFPIESDDAAKQRLVFAMFVCLATTCVATGWPGASTLGDATGVTGLLGIGWIATQSFLLMLPGVLIGGLLAKRFPRVGRVVAAVLIYAVLMIVLLDVITFHWIAERFLSPAIFRVATTLSGPLAGHVTSTMVASAALLVTAIVAYGAIAWYGSVNLTAVWSRSASRFSSTAVLGICLATCLAVSAAVILGDRPVWEQMGKHSWRHPFCAFHLVADRGVGPALPATPGNARRISVSVSRRLTHGSATSQRQLVLYAWIVLSERTWRKRAAWSR